MLHLPEELKVEKKEKVEKVNTDVKVKKVQPVKAEKEDEVKYNGLHAFDVTFKRKEQGRFRVLVIARTIESAKNRVKELTDVEEVLMATSYKEVDSNKIVKKEKKAGVYTHYMKKID